MTEKTDWKFTAEARMGTLEAAVFEFEVALRELTPYVRHGFHKNAKTGCGGTWKKGGGCDCGATQAIERARAVLETWASVNAHAVSSPAGTGNTQNSGHASGS